MWGNQPKDKKPGTTTSGTADTDKGQTTVIAQGTELEGKFICNDSVRLDGTIKGEVRISKRIVMGADGRVVGNIWATDAVIKGRITGDIHVTESLHLTESAVIEGNIAAKTMIVDEGARYNGTCKIGDGGVRTAAAAAPATTA
jgi:cytoskeletal protein CcmA (bactofilin family)